MRRMILVRLTAEEERIAIIAGVARQYRRELAGVRRDKYTYLDNEAQGHIDGVIGEIVVAKVIGIPWRETIYSKDEADLDDCIEVRLRTKHWYEIFIHPEEVHNEKKNTRLYFLVTKEKDDPNYRVHGYITPLEAAEIGVFKQVTSKNPPDWFVSQEQLHPVEGFLKMLHDGNS